MLSELSERSKEKETNEVEWNTPTTPQERTGSFIAMAGDVALVLFLTWGNDAGLIAGHSRSTDLDLAGQSFNGFSASGETGMEFLLCGSLFLNCSNDNNNKKSRFSFKMVRGARFTIISFHYFKLFSDLSLLIRRREQLNIRMVWGSTCAWRWSFGNIRVIFRPTDCSAFSTSTFNCVDCGRSNIGGGYSSYLVLIGPFLDGLSTKEERKTFRLKRRPRLMFSVKKSSCRRR